MAGPIRPRMQKRTAQQIQALKKSILEKARTFKGTFDGFAKLFPNENRHGLKKHVAILRGAGHKIELERKKSIQTRPPSSQTKLGLYNLMKKNPHFTLEQAANARGITVTQIKNQYYAMLGTGLEINFAKSQSPSIINTENRTQHPIARLAEKSTLNPISTQLTPAQKERIEAMRQFQAQVDASHPPTSRTRVLDTRERIQNLRKEAEKHKSKGRIKKAKDLERIAQRLELQLKEEGAL